MFASNNSLRGSLNTKMENRKELTVRPLSPGKRKPKMAGRRPSEMIHCPCPSGELKVIVMSIMDLWLEANVPMGHQLVILSRGLG